MIGAAKDGADRITGGRRSSRTHVTGENEQAFTGKVCFCLPLGNAARGADALRINTMVAIALKQRDTFKLLFVGGRRHRPLLPVLLAAPSSVGSTASSPSLLLPSSQLLGNGPSMPSSVRSWILMGPSLAV